jgi:hypothetical protein
MLHCQRNIMRKVLYSGIFFATGLAPALALDPTGDWRVADGVANIRVAECNGSVWGAVSWEKTPGGRDKNNPDVSKQNRPTLGMPILIDMKKKAGVDQWEGQVYNARTDSPTVRPSSRSARTKWKSRAACWASSAAAKPGPASRPRYQAAPPTAWPGGHRGRQPGPPGRSRLPKRQVRNRCQRSRPIPSAISVYSRISRGLPISAGWNSNTAASVVTSESARSLPMLAVPG